MSDDPLETATDESGGASPDDAPDTPASASGEVAKAAPPRLNVSALMERIEESVGSTLERELGHAMVALTAIRNSLDAVTGTLRRLEERIDVLETNSARVAASPAVLPPPPPPPSADPAVLEDASARLASIERRLIDIDDNTTREILDAIVSVAQHLEAVQTATAWAIVRELRLA